MNNLFEDSLKTIEQMYGFKFMESSQEICLKLTHHQLILL